MKESDSIDFTCARCNEVKPQNSLQPVNTRLEQNGDFVDICKACEDSLTRSVIEHIVKHSMH